MKRYLARRVIHEGHEHGLSIVTITKHADGLWHVDVEKYDREIYSTIYHPGTIKICDPLDGFSNFVPGPEPPLLIFLP